MTTDMATLDTEDRLLYAFLERMCSDPHLTPDGAYRASTVWYDELLAWVIEMPKTRLLKLVDLGLVEVELPEGGYIIRLPKRDTTEAERLYARLKEGLAR